MIFVVVSVLVLLAILSLCIAVVLSNHPVMLQTAHHPILRWFPLPVSQSIDLLESCCGLYTMGLLYENFALLQDNLVADQQ